ncbi:recombinase family protein [Spongiibacter marinus]|uniref:recombinase family protein n=1 Tax=Spongiibacter marinus TaxID=354246 RepID=UPI0004820E7D|nr:recombinase family protein [Spongiibacter marinus]
MALIGYARVSTVGQDLDYQLDRLRSVGCEKIFSSKHSGKADANKKQLSELLSYVREGDTVIVTKLDRLGRSLSQVLGTIELLAGKGIYLKAIDQNLDTSDDSPIAKAMVQLLGMFSELERNFIITRTQEGKAASGNYGGRPTKLDKTSREEVVTKFSAGLSKSQLAKEYGVSRATIMRIIKG